MVCLCGAEKQAQGLSHGCQALYHGATYIPGLLVTPHFEPGSRYLGWP